MNKNIILIDSSGVLHNNYHGYKKGRQIYMEHEGRNINVTALSAYLKYIRIVSGQMEYDELIHVLDPEGGSKRRKEAYPEYKGNRSESEEDLTIQKNMLEDVLTSFGHKCLRVQDEESDDVIATLCNKYNEQGDVVLIISSDKDLMQLVKDGKVCFARYVKSGKKDERGFETKTHEFFEEVDVVNKLGVRPDQVADLLALIGDSSDNIPGVKGIGPAKAIKLLNEYGSLSSIVTNAKDIKGDMGESIRNEASNIPLYKYLTGAFTDVNVEIPDCSITYIDKSKNNYYRKGLQIPDNFPDDINGDLRTNPPEIKYFQQNNLKFK